MKETVYLVGFMGCGKTTVGEQLALLQSKHFVDMDQLIVQQEDMPIATIFQVYGEDFFRKLETKVLLETAQMHTSIVATGGGIISKAENRAFLKKHHVIYLKWPFEILYGRIKNDAKRPLAKNKEQLKALFLKREKYYEEVATYTISCEGYTPYGLANFITERLR